MHNNEGMKQKHKNKRHKMHQYQKHEAVDEGMNLQALRLPTKHHKRNDKNSVIDYSTAAQ